ncbi:MAG: SPOR domain-containing protein [Rhodanobacter sp.]
MLRLLFVLLSALNIAVAAWLWLGQPYAVDARPASDAGVPTLRLLSELPPAAATVAPVALAGDEAITSSALRCLALGPFMTPQDLRVARQLLAAQTTRTRARQELVARDSSWWVYLPPAANRAQALATARQLANRQISDYFVVSSGPQPNSVSLGVFKDPANATRRRNQVVAAGFPARMDERVESRPEYWLDMVVATGTQVDWGAVRTRTVRAHSIGCF